MYQERNYLIFNVSELNKIDFNQVLENSADTIRKTVDGTKTFVKWNGNEPSFVSELTTKEGPYSHDEIVEILNMEEWSVLPKLLS
jgi:hypothetical protein